MTESRLQEVDPHTLSRWLAVGDAVLIDVREPDEYAIESIPGSLLLPASSFDTSPFRFADVPVVLHCQSGQRSAQAAARLAAADDCPAPTVYSLRGGIRAWKQAGLPTREGGSAALRMPIMRQVQIVAGSLVVVGTALAAAVSPWLLVIPAFIGAGLAFAGVTGTCGMATMLSAMPWNRSAGRACAKKE
jgi:rhodanese-related sulfurtransferase